MVWNSVAELFDGETKVQDTNIGHATVILDFARRIVYNTVLEHSGAVLNVVLAHLMMYVLRFTVFFFLALNKIYFCLSDVQCFQTE